MTSSLAKSKPSVCTFKRFLYKFSSFLMFLYIQIDLIILKTYDQQFTLTTKNHCISSLSQEIGCEERLRNDLFCVEWDVNLSSDSSSTNVFNVNSSHAQADTRRNIESRTSVYLRRKAGTHIAAYWPTHLSLSRDGIFSQFISFP